VFGGSGRLATTRGRGNRKQNGITNSLQKPVLRGVKKRGHHNPSSQRGRPTYIRVRQCSGPGDYGQFMGEASGRKSCGKMLERGEVF